MSTKKMSVSQARKLAFAMHAKQLDKVGQPYTAHLEAVRMGVQMFGGDTDEQITALFHDAVEDGHTSLKELKEIGVPGNALLMIEAVTKRSGEGQEHYLDRVIKAGHGAMRVKLADLLHNTRHDRLEALKATKNGKGGQHNVDRLLKKYRPSIARLMLELGLIADEDSQAKLATKPVGTAGAGWSSGYSSAEARNEYQVQTLIVGDWPLEWEAPIMQKLSQHGDAVQRFVLANGEIKAVPKYVGGEGKPRSLKIMTKAQWTGRWADVSKLKASDAQIEAYEGVLEAMKNKPLADNDLMAEVDATL